MKCAVVYFSMTGNTEKIAGTIQKGIQTTAGNCDLLKVKEIKAEALQQYDLVGLGSPVLGFVEAAPVTRLITNMRGMAGKHAFAFATHGTRVEFFFPSIVTKLMAKGLVVIGLYNCYADVFMGGMVRPYPTAGHPDEIDLGEAEVFGREMVERSQRVAAGETSLIPRLPEWAEYDVEEYMRKRAIVEIEWGSPIEMSKRGFRPVKLSFNREDCNGCGLCVKKCLVKCIDLTGTPPIDERACISCGGCADVCPTGAIFMEWETSPANAELTQWGSPARKMPRPVVDPKVHQRIFEEYYLKPLAKAEKEGRFRRLVKLEEQR
jgi:ferredoxin/flavodoxin